MILLMYNGTMTGVLHTIQVREVSEFGCEGNLVEADVLVNGPVADIGDERRSLYQRSVYL